MRKFLLMMDTQHMDEETNQHLKDLEINRLKDDNERLRKLLGERNITLAKRHNEMKQLRDNLAEARSFLIIARQEGYGGYGTWYDNICDFLIRTIKI